MKPPPSPAARAALAAHTPRPARAPPQGPSRPLDSASRRCDRLPGSPSGLALHRGLDVCVPRVCLSAASSLGLTGLTSVCSIHRRSYEGGAESGPNTGGLLLITRSRPLRRVGVESCTHLTERRGEAWRSEVAVPWPCGISARALRSAHVFSAAARHQLGVQPASRRDRLARSHSENGESEGPASTGRGRPASQGRGPGDQCTTGL